MTNVSKDVRFALRQLRRAPSFAITAVLTLALGIGANTAIFSLLDQALLRSLPVPHSNELVVLEGTGSVWDGHFSKHGGDAEAYFSYPMYKDLRDRSQAFSGLIATSPVSIDFSYAGDTSSQRVEIVSGNYFTTLGVTAALGRVLFSSDDTAPNGNPVAVVSFDFWSNQLGARSNVVGQTVLLNAHPYEIVGISAPNFRSAIWGETPAAFIPMSMLDQIVPGQGKRLTDHTDRWVNILGRLAPGKSREHAEAQLAPLWHALRGDELKALGPHSKHFQNEFLTNSRLKVLPGASGFSYQRPDYKRPLLIVMGMAVLVLLIATVNVASLVLVRSATRAREFAVRYALGARSGQIARQLLLEGLLIGTMGGAAGLLLGFFAARVLLAVVSGGDPTSAFVATLDHRIWFFNFATALGVSLLFSLTPALQLRTPDLNGAMRQQSTGHSAALSFRRLVVCLQIGLSVILLVSAGLLVRTMQNLRHADVGFRPAHLVTFGVNPRLAGYTPEGYVSLNDKIVAALDALPGAQSVGVTNVPELNNQSNSDNVTVAGYNAPSDEDYSVDSPFVSPAYLSTLGVRLLGGRYFTDDDDANHPSVTIVNLTFVHHFCGGSVSSCIGRLMTSGDGNHIRLDTEIIGVVSDNRHEDVLTPPSATWFRPLRQDKKPSWLYYYVRTQAAPAGEVSLIRRSMQQVDSSLALNNFRTMDEQIEHSLTRQRTVSLLAVSFGALAAILAGVGLYGVLAYTTARRTREIGIRIALGSSRLGVSRLVFSDVLMLTGVSLIMALPCALLLSRLIRNQLYNVSAADPLVVASVSVLVVFIACLAAFFPARRATSVNPTEALRIE